MNWTEKAESATHYLVETDETYALLRVAYVRAQKQAKSTWSAIFLRLDGTVEARKAAAEIHPDYQLAVQHEFEALLDMERTRNKRDTACIVIEFWRSYNKSVGG